MQMENYGLWFACENGWLNFNEKEVMGQLDETYHRLMGGKRSVNWTYSWTIRHNGEGCALYFFTLSKNGNGLDIDLKVPGHRANLECMQSVRELYELVKVRVAELNAARNEKSNPGS